VCENVQVPVPIHQTVPLLATHSVKLRALKVKVGEDVAPKYIAPLQLDPEQDKKLESVTKRAVVPVLIAITTP
jgi:hypothetical protein